MWSAIVMHCIYHSENEGGIDCNQTEMPLQEFFETLHSISWKMSCLMFQKPHSQQSVAGFQDPFEEGMTISMQTIYLTLLSWWHIHI